PAAVVAVEVQSGNRTAAVERYDLLTGQKVNRFDVTAPARLAALDPDGKHGLFLEAEKAQRLDLWNLADGKHVTGWRPYARADERSAGGPSAFVPANGRVLPGNPGHRRTLWSLPACKAAYVIELPNLSHPRLTGGGKYLVGLDGDRLRCFEVGTGQAVGDTA